MTSNGETRRGIKFYLDENLSHRLAELARRRGLDVTSAQESSRTGLSDGEQLRHAAEQGRIIVTRDEGDFLRLTNDYIAAGRSHTGLLNVRWRVTSEQIGTVVNALERFVAEQPQGMQPNQIGWLRYPVDG